MTLEQLGLQLGIAGLLVVVGFKIAMRFIDRWGSVEDKKTEALTKGFEQVVTKIDAQQAAVSAAISALIQTVSSMMTSFENLKGTHGERFARLEGEIKVGWRRVEERLNTIMGHLDLTPPPTTVPPPTGDRERSRDIDRELRGEREQRDTIDESSGVPRSRYGRAPSQPVRRSTTKANRDE